MGYDVVQNIAEDIPLKLDFEAWRLLLAIIYPNTWIRNFWNTVYVFYKKMARINDRLKVQWRPFAYVSWPERQRRESSNGLRIL